MSGMFVLSISIISVSLLAESRKPRQLFPTFRDGNSSGLHRKAQWGHGASSFPESVKRGFKTPIFNTHRGVNRPSNSLARVIAEAVRMTPTICSVVYVYVCSRLLCHKITIYKDDVLVLLSTPEVSIPVIDIYSCFSGKSITLMKSEAMSLGTLSTIPITVPSFFFQMGCQWFCVLGNLYLPYPLISYKPQFQLSSDIV